MGKENNNEVKESSENSYDFKAIEKKWQKRWEEEEVFKVEKDKRDKEYVLEMFPYPSGSGLHMGHALNYVIGDIYSRFKLMNNFNVLHPMGYDSLGLPAENAAIKAGEHPKDYTEKTVNNFIKQQKKLGLSYDWSRTVCSHHPEYYRWDQWIFLKMYEEGLAYKGKAPVNWCPKCETVLANAQVEDGKCWRHDDTDVEIKQLEQWFLKIKDYAEELYEGIGDLDWPEDIKAMQKNWIGKSKGVEINFEVENPDGETEEWPIFTTRPDTIYGVTFMVISTQHPDLMDLISEEQEEEVKKFLKKSKSVSEKDMDNMEKEGVFTGSYAINPANGEKVPIYTGNFVVAGYGSGMVMAVPAHDQRDFEFAKKYDIPIKIVVQPLTNDINPDKMIRAFTEEGKIVNSGDFSGVSSQDGRDMIADWLEEEGYGERTIQYKLKDWLISRQRYWGTPIPIIHCDKCGVVPVPEEDLPVELPTDVEFGKGNPLETNEEWIKTKCPECDGQARRETETMDTFVNSSWYFLRYCDPNNEEKIFDSEKANYWCPIDTYIGGKEHATGHLIYSRFYTKFLRDIGLLEFDEPARKLFNQGMLLGPDGEKMSKSKGNVVSPDTVSKKYGIDTARLFVVSQASPDKSIQWTEKGVKGSLKFIKKVFNYVLDVKIGESNEKTEHFINKTIKGVNEDIENFDYNLAVIKIREMFDHLAKDIGKKDLEKCIKLLSPFCPHIAEELWEKIGNEPFVSVGEWPEVNEDKINPEIDKKEKQKENLIEDVKNVIDILKSDDKWEKKEKIKLYPIPPEIDLFKDVKGKLESSFGLEVEVRSIKEAKKEEKEIKAKPGKPGILIE